MSAQFLVYDVLVYEFASLTNKEKPAGEYRVKFSANGGGSKLTSGIYFYQLTSENYIQTRKMVLINNVILEILFIKGVRFWHK